MLSSKEKTASIWCCFYSVNCACPRSSHCEGFIYFFAVCSILCIRCHKSLSVQKVLLKNEKIWLFFFQNKHFKTKRFPKYVAKLWNIVSIVDLFLKSTCAVCGVYFLFNVDLNITVCLSGSELDVPEFLAFFENEMMTNKITNYHIFKRYNCQFLISEYVWDETLKKKKKSERPSQDLWIWEIDWVVKPGK